MSAYTLGVLLGRLAASIILTYILIWVFSGFKAKRANQRIKKPLAWILVATLFLLGIAGGAAAEQLPERDVRPLVATDFPDAKLTLYVRAPKVSSRTVTKTEFLGSYLLTKPLYLKSISKSAADLTFNS